jgi:hypothetical protein
MRHRDADAARRRRCKAWLVGIGAASLVMVSVGTVLDRVGTQPSGEKEAAPSLAVTPPSTSLTPRDGSARVPHCPGQVAPGEARWIAVARAGIAGCVERVGLDGEGRIGVPATITVAGWFDRSSLPGNPGLSVMDGHFSSTSAGVFQRLTDVKVGDRVLVALGDGSRRTFTVRKVATYPVADSMTNLYRDAPNFDRPLALVSCTGVWSQALHTFTDRVVVIATPAATHARVPKTV